MGEVGSVRDGDRDSRVRRRTSYKISKGNANSDVTARLGLEAVALAWLLRAQA